MRLKPIEPGEHSCRNCINFNWTTRCWDMIKNESKCIGFIAKEKKSEK